MSRKRYFLEVVIEEDDEVWCAYLPTIKEEMEERGLTEAKVFEAKSIKNDEFIFCEEVYEWSERGECGKWCDSYAPRNGKNGCCRHLGNGYEPTEKFKIIKLKNNAELK
jgi:hypothetical protein